MIIPLQKTIDSWFKMPVLTIKNMAILVFRRFTGLTKAPHKFKKKEIKHLLNWMLFLYLERNDRYEIQKETGCSRSISIK